MKRKSRIVKAFSRFWVTMPFVLTHFAFSLTVLLGIMESLLGLDPQLAERIALRTEIMPWLLKRIQGKGYDSNRGYASEILSILLQESRGKSICGRERITVFTTC